MGRKPKYSKEIKLKACQNYTNGKGSFGSIANNLNVNPETVRRWYYEYRNNGENSFKHLQRNRDYPKELKESIVESYISGSGSAVELGSEHNIPVSVLLGWLKKYYNGMVQTDYIPKAEVYTMKYRKTTFQERLEIVKWVIEHDMNYKGAADNYDLRYSLVYSWVRKYKENGADALKNQKRGPKGKSSIDKSSLSETDRLRQELEQEKTLRKQAEFKLEVLKKKEEIEKKLHSRK